ncbi:MAG: carboxypeptidase M32 [Candidatus Dadabacteria bacterium]
MASAKELYQEYKRKMQEIADLRNASAVLQWDQEVYLPLMGAAFRGQQISTLSELSHRMFVSNELGNILEELQQSGELQEEQKRNIQKTLEDYTKAKKYPSEFVRALSEQVNKTFHSWIEARKQNSFVVYQGNLEKLVDLKRKEAELLGYKQHPYDALLDDYEKGSTVALLDKTFSDLLPSLEELFRKIVSKPQVEDSFIHQHFPKDQQWNWGMQLVKDLHFNLEAGRQDISEHPFTTSFNSQDVRITTRIDENNFANMTWSCIHEVGHALYEQGLKPEYYGLPLGEAASLSIHESQSRLWENCVGRSKAYWQFYYPQLSQMFPVQFQNISYIDFYKSINKVQPSLIRTEADEITYHFHVFIRYELEKKLIEGSLAVNDIPAYWNAQYEKLLNVKVPDDKHGALQDVHWSHGSFGYFPTYSLGSLYAAQFFNTAKQQIKGLENEIANGNTAGLLEWLRTNIHQKGRFYTSEELCKEVTGETLNASIFMDYLVNKYTFIYNL